MTEEQQYLKKKIACQRLNVNLRWTEKEMSEKTVNLTTEGTSLNQEGHCENLKKKKTRLLTH